MSGSVEAMRKFLVALSGVVVLAGACVAPAPEPTTDPTTTTTERVCHRHHRHGRHRHRWHCHRPTTSTTVRPTTSTTRPPTSTTTTTRPPASTTTTTTTSTVPGGPGPDGPPGSWRLVWGDEFTGTRLDTTRWRPNWLAGSDTAVTPPVNTAELSCYDPGHVTVSDGMLHLTADSNVPSGCRTRSGAARYASGMVQTDDDFHYRTGYVEARLHLPGPANHPENWPAFWTNGQSWPADGEIDVMEVLGGEPRWHYHGTGIDRGSGFDLISPKAGWHTFGVWRRPGRVDFYYDGRHVGTVTGVADSPHYIVLNHALSTSISPPVVVPSTLRADWVRVWEPA